MFSSFVYTLPFHIEYRMRARVFLLYHLLCALCLLLSLSPCCAADTNSDEGKRMSDASRESDIYILCSVRVRWRYRLT